ncbi:hypothetical protein DL98DRAFT_541693 [Cadophora sp. DSE1049]|nr:hypothetical protein DL98DRAFT_541693 [Cadophora sp. DSE1049]
MAPSVFKKVKMRLNRTKEETPVQETARNPANETANVATSETANIPIRDPETPPPTYEKSEIEPKPSPLEEVVIRATKDSKSASKPWLEVVIEPSYIPDPIEFINENSIPQWRWPNTHVRAWLLAVLTNEIKCTPELALKLVQQEMGIGANLYCRTDVYWNRVLDWKAGAMMYRKLMGMREMEGAVPEFCHVRKR